VTAREYMARVHLCNCVICVFKCAIQLKCQEAHHVIPGDDWSVIPLCAEHHQGPVGVHGMHRRAFNNFWKVDETWLLARTAELVAKL